MAEKDSIETYNYYILKNMIDNLEKDKAELLDFIRHYRHYFHLFHEFINSDVLGGGFIDPETWDELIEGGLSNMDYYAMLGHIDSLEKENKKFVKFPMLKHKPFLEHQEIDELSEDLGYKMDG